MSNQRNEPESAPPTSEATWEGLSATVQQAMEWGIDLSGQLARVHEEQDIVVGAISAATIARTRFGQPSLPTPDPHATTTVEDDVAALADALRALVADPPDAFVDALLPPYATAVALGQELQGAQRELGVPVAPIPYERAPRTPLGGFPLEVPPDPASIPPPVREPVPPIDPDVQAGLDQRPDPRILLVIVIAVALVAVVAGIGWR